MEGIMSIHLLPRFSETTLSTPGTSAAFRPLKISLAALLNGMRWVGGPGTGKTRGMALTVVWPHVWHAWPAIVVDPTGALCSYLFNKVVYFDEETQSRLWPRLRYVDMAATDFIVPMPLYKRRGEETLFAIANRFPEVLKRLDEDLVSAPILGWNSLHSCAIYAGQIAAALGRQLDFVADLVAYPQRYKNELRHALALHPELDHAVSYFRALMDPTSNSLRDRRTGSFLTKLLPFLADPLLLATFSAHEGGIGWAKEMNLGHTVLLDFGGEIDRERRQFKLIWCFLEIVEFLKSRGTAGRKAPILFALDEISNLTNERSRDNSIVGRDLHELVTVYGRNYGIKICCAHQYPSQLEPAINHALLQLGTQVIGNVQHPDDALYLARQFHRYDPALVRKYEPLWMNVQELVGRDTFSFPRVIDERTTEYTADEQLLILANEITNLPPHTFLVRPALDEGNLTGALRRASLERLDAGLYPDDATVAEVRRRLRKRDGVSVTTLLDEIAARRYKAIGEASRQGNAILNGDGSHAQVPHPVPTQKRRKPQPKPKGREEADERGDAVQEGLWQQP
ncbi:MAG: hypothetical protein IT328_23335 [Caldilineaceae bacterium]|nr:hypothetical protein [Caldilineaceae bacterium]